MIMTKEDLVGYFVDCTNKEDLEAFINLVHKLGLTTSYDECDKSIERWIRAQNAVVYSGSENGFLTSSSDVDYMIKCGYKQFSASDIELNVAKENEIKNNTRSYYEPVHYESIFETMKDFREGLLFYKRDTDSYQKVTTERELLENHKLITLYKLVRFIPIYDDKTENEAMNAVDVFLDSCSSFDSEPGPITIAHDEWKYQYQVEHSDFLEACRVALRAVGEIE